MPRVKKTTVVKKSSPERNSSTSTPAIVKPTQNSVAQYVKNPRFWVGVGVVVLAVVVFLCRGLFIAATVNGEPISRLSVVQQLEKQSGKQALDNLVVESLVAQEANKRHITVSQKDIDAQIATIESQLKGQGVTLDAALSARGLTRADLVDQLRLQAYLNKMVGGAAVSDADVQSYIDKNKDTLPTDVSDDQLKAQVKQQLEQQAVQGKTQTFVADLQKKAKINYFVNYSM